MALSNREEDIWHVTLDGSGRVLLPVAIRNDMGASPGQRLVWVRDAGGLRLQSYEQSLAELQEYYCSLAPKDVSWTEELFAERRREAESE